MKDKSSVAFWIRWGFMVGAAWLFDVVKFPLDTPKWLKFVVLVIVLYFALAFAEFVCRRAGLASRKDENK